MFYLYMVRIMSRDARDTGSNPKLDPQLEDEARVIIKPEVQDGKEEFPQSKYILGRPFLSLRLSMLDIYYQIEGTSLAQVPFIFFDTLNFMAYSIICIGFFLCYSYLKGTIAIDVTPMYGLSAFRSQYSLIFFGIMMTFDIQKRFERFIYLDPLKFSREIGEVSYQFQIDCQEKLNNLQSYESHRVSRDWWKSSSNYRPFGCPTMAWAQFSEAFLERVVAYSLKDQMCDEFDHLEQVSYQLLYMSHISMSYHGVHLLVFSLNHRGFISL